MMPFWNFASAPGCLPILQHQRGENANFFTIWLSCTSMIFPNNSNAFLAIRIKQLDAMRKPLWAVADSIVVEGGSTFCNVLWPLFFAVSSKPYILEEYRCGEFDKIFGIPYMLFVSCFRFFPVWLYLLSNGGLQFWIFVDKINCLLLLTEILC